MASTPNRDGGMTGEPSGQKRGSTEVSPPSNRAYPAQVQPPAMRVVKKGWWSGTTESRVLAAVLEKEDLRDG